MNIYIAGPMSGHEDWNYPAFNEASNRITRAGMTPLNPADHDLGFADLHPGEADLIRAHYMRMDIDMVMRADAIAVLEGWEKSVGAQVEVSIGRVLQLPIYDARTLKLLQPEAVTLEAHRLVSGHRGSSYGHPHDDFSRTGRMWGAILGIDPIPPHLVGLCMAAVKISREVNAPSRDNRVDIAGYAETVDMVRERQKELGQ